MSITPTVIRQVVNNLVTVTGTGVTLVPPGSVFFVSQAKGQDVVNGVPNTCQSRSNPCLTVNHALDVARDGTSINILPDVPFFRITETIRVAKLVTIQPDTGTVVLSAVVPVPIFDVTAQGGPTQHVIIQNFQIGGCTPPRQTAASPPPPTPTGTGVPDCLTVTSAPAAFRLINDNYTEIAKNTIGAQDLPIDNGIILSNSDHPNIHDNIIQGNTRFTFTPLLVVGKNTTGFGIVTAECFGLAPLGTSDSVTIANNLFTNLWLAGIWLCSDGGGEHSITGNTFRNNWRGIALKDVVDSNIDSNTLTDDQSDGIIVYGASLRNTVQKNLVESHVAVAAAGIRIGWIADPTMPLSNNVTGNKLVRDTIGLHIFGARTTVVTNNEIKISGARTAILISPSTFLGDPGTQPYNTEITGNTIVFIGPCGAVIGCAIRLVGTTVPVLATDNDWGLRHASEVEDVIWHNQDDPALGVVTFTPFRNQVAEMATATPTGGAAAPTTLPPRLMPTSPSPTATPSPTPGSTSTATGPVTRSASGAGVPETTLSLPAGCTPATWPGPSGVVVADAITGITPAAAQRDVSVWHQDGADWLGWSATAGPQTDVFVLQHGEPLQVCVTQPAKWEIATQIGGP